MIVPVEPPKFHKSANHVELPPNSVCALVTVTAVVEPPDSNASCLRAKLISCS